MTEIEDENTEADNSSRNPGGLYVGWKIIETSIGRCGKKKNARKWGKKRQKS